MAVNDNDGSAMMPETTGAASATSGARTVAGTEPFSRVPGELSAPSTIGRYAIVQRLGAGSFGVVYRAHDPQLMRDVAIKVARRERIRNAHDLDVCLAEARNAAKLDHPGIVPVFDVGVTADSLFFVVVKLVGGTNLAKRVNGLPWQATEAAELMASVAEAVHHAHERGLIHRDIKPANILLDGFGRPAVTDFGLALRDDRTADTPGVFGTPGYMSPEQARGEGPRVDARSDIYSLGVVLYELLTGQSPYHAKTLTEFVEEITHAEIQPPRQILTTVPKDLEWICMKALAKRPRDRYQSAIDLADDLRDWLDRRKRETRRGRAELLLQERVRQWRRSRQPRFLPTLGECVSIGLFTRRIDWNDEQRAMLWLAARQHAIRMVAASFGLAVFLFLSWLFFLPPRPTEWEVFANPQAREVERRLVQLGRDWGGSNEKIVVSRELEFLVGAAGLLEPLSAATFDDAFGIVKTMLRERERLDDQLILDTAVEAYLPLSLGQPESRRDLTPLREIVNERESSDTFAFVRLAAIRAAGKLGDVESLPTLLSLAGDMRSDTTTQVAAVNALGDFANLTSATLAPSLFSEMQRALSGLLETLSSRPAEQRRLSVLRATLIAYASVAPSDAKHLFRFALDPETEIAALRGINSILVRHPQLTEQVVRDFVEWRTTLTASSLSNVTFGPGEALINFSLFGTDLPEAKQETAAKAVVIALVQAHSDASAEARDIAGNLLRTLLPTANAPRLDPQVDASARQAQIDSWLKWWTAAEKSIRFRSGRLIEQP